MVMSYYRTWKDHIRIRQGGVMHSTARTMIAAVASLRARSACCVILSAKISSVSSNTILVQIRNSSDEKKEIAIQILKNGYIKKKNM
jgi:hypothetical protein